MTIIFYFCVWTDFTRKSRNSACSCGLSGNLLQELESEFLENVSKCREITPEFPAEWGIDENDFKSILSQLYSEEWIDDSWNNFYNLLKQTVL